MGKIKEGDIIAVDFDGTLCENAWPGIGSPYKELIDFLIRCKKDGAQLIRSREKSQCNPTLPRRWMRCQ